MKDRLGEINRELAKESVELPEQETYPPSVESIGMVLEIPPNIIHYWAKTDPQFRQALNDMKEVDGADVALLLMETQKRYTV
jgi:hypothetical protein